MLFIKGHIMRKTLFKWHSISALIALIPIMIIAVTGSILVFKVEIDTWLMPAHMQVQYTEQTPRLNFNELIENIEAKHPEFLMGSWEIFDGAPEQEMARADTAYVIEKATGYWHKLYINQYTGELLSAPVTVVHDFTDWLLSLHYTFLLDFTGTVIGAVMSIILFFLGVSGIILHKQFWKKLFTLRFGAAKRVFFSDVHKLFGIVSSPVILIVALTGAYFNIYAVVHEIEEHSEPHPLLTQALYGDNVDFQHLLDRTETDLDNYRPTYMTFPFEPELHITFYGEVPTGNPLTSEYASMLTYSRDTGELMSSYDIRTAPAINVVVDTFRKLHFGYFAGLPSKIIWAVLGLTPLWLSLTGLYFYWFRKHKGRKKRLPSQATQLG